MSLLFVGFLMGASTTLGAWILWVAWRRSKCTKAPGWCSWRRVLYLVDLPQSLDHVVENAASDLGMSPGEVFRRALLLFASAVAADEVVLVEDGEKRTALLRQGLLDGS